MRLDEYLHRHAAHWVTHQRMATALTIGLPESARPALKFLWTTANAHACLQSEARRALALGPGAQADALRWMCETTDACIHALAYLTDEPDPFQTVPDAVKSGATGQGMWLELGLSALLLELAFARLGQALPFHQGMRDEMAWMSDGFKLERAYALAEAGRLAASVPDGAQRLRESAARFRVPAERAWGDAYVLDAKSALEGCIDKAAAAYAADAIRDVPELKGPFWPLIEPHIDRHAKLFKIGRIKKLAAHAAVKFLL